MAWVPESAGYHQDSINLISQIILCQAGEELDSLETIIINLMAIPNYLSCIMLLANWLTG